jgi:quercetin dioxygenase-like cupin family protein
MPKAINLEKCFGMFQDTFSPKIIGELNGQLVMVVVKCQGDKAPWHTHDNEDEMFLVMDGELEVQEQGGSATLKAGEMCIVKRGTEHQVVPKGLVKLMLFEPAGIEHTGKVKSEITKKSFVRLEV